MRIAEDNRNKILYVITSLNIGGTERHLAEIAPRLRELGQNPAIYCLYNVGVLAAEVQRSGVQVISPPFEWDPKETSPVAHYALLFVTCAKLLAIMLMRRPHIVHFFLPTATLVGGPLALLARVPIRVMSRRSLNCYQAKWPRFRRLEFWLHKRMTMLLGNSAAIVRELTELEECEPEKVRLIYNGIEAARYRVSEVNRVKMRKQLGLPAHAFVAIIVANLIPYKGQKDLVRALARVHDQLPVPWTLLCVGRDDGLLPDLQRMTAEYGLSENISFLGLRADIPDLLASADLGVLCSHEEGFANAILEYMSAGLPTIVTDVGGNAEAVIHDETGLVVPAKNTEALGAAIRQLASDPERAKAMGAAGQSRVKEFFTLERCLAEYDLFYRELLQEAHSKAVSRSKEMAQPNVSKEKKPPATIRKKQLDQTVSVIIPVFNRSQLVHRAIQSVLKQTHSDLELIVVDDGSTDDLADSLSLIKDPRLRLASHDENKGAAAARNTGISEARGQYVAFLDSDDYWLPEKLERQLEFMRSFNRGTRLSCTAYKIFSHRFPEGELYFGKPTVTENDMQRGCRAGPGTTLLAERALFDETGPMNEQMSRLEDWDWLLRCLKFTNLETLNEALSVVDYSSDDRKIYYDDVRFSVDLMKHNHFITRGFLPSIPRLRYIATLENELAVAAYGNKRYGLAIWHTLKSLCTFPFRNMNSLRRVGSGILLDMRTPEKK